MDKETRARALSVLQVVQDDMESDVRKADGKPLTGEVVATLHAQLAAAITTVARILQLSLQEEGEASDGR